jgi:molybdate transport system permease protein
MSAPVGTFLGVVLTLLLTLPILSLFVSVTPGEFSSGVQHPLFQSAFWLSMRTTFTSLLFIVLAGSPLAFWLATSKSFWTRPVELLVQLPIVIPPAVVGIALLSTFGRRGSLGPLLSSVGLEIPFTESAVILAQVVVAAPFYIQGAASAFRAVDPDLLLVARTLGATGPSAAFRVAGPLALPALLAAASLSFARALGEFGATLLFAGNRKGVSQTMPLSILDALETDLRLAVVLSLTLTLLGAVALLLLRRLSPSPRRLGAERNARGAS